MIVVRAEAPGDVAAIRAVVTAAFGRADEAELVDALRLNGAITLSLVAEDAGRIVGHVLFSPVTIVASAGDVLPLRAVGLAPLAVLPASERRGVGGALVRAGLACCRDADFAVVVVLGDPEYYSRFGFVDARRHDLGCEYKAPPGAFQVVEFRPGTLLGEPAIAQYREEFANV